MVNSLFAQGIHIRENAVITPGQVKRVQEGLGVNVNSHVIRFELYWSGADSAYIQAIRGYINPDWFPCPFDTTSGWSVSSPIVLEMNSPVAGEYHFFPTLATNGSNCSVNCKLFSDGELIDSYSNVFTGSIVMPGGSFCPWGDWDTEPISSFYTPYSSGFELDITRDGVDLSPGEFFNGASAELSLYPLFDCTTTSWDPGADPVTFTIISGNQYASFHETDSATGMDIKVGSVMTSPNGYPMCSLVADSVQPDSTGDWVTIEAESNGLVSMDSIQVFPPPVVVRFHPRRVAPGDTANIIVKQWNPDGTITDFPRNQLFEVGIWSKGNCGTILSGSDTAQYFIYRLQPFKFIASDSVDVDSVGIFVGEVFEVVGSTVPGGKGNSGKSVKAKPTMTSLSVKSPNLKISVNKSGTNPTGRKAVSEANNFSSSLFNIGYVKIKRTILLGQTKYYYAAQDPNNPNKLIIKETTTTPPALGAGGLANATFDDPVATAGSEKNPVYWEKKWPQYSGNTFTSMAPLTSGMIRLVGRYWEDGKTFKTTLKAHTPDGRSGSIDIEVVKPARLGTSTFAKSRDHGLDVNGNPYSVDSVCISWGGKFGFPPQDLKAQYESESVFDAHLNAYAPAYRYEPWTVEFWPDVQDMKDISHFWVSQDMGNGDPVPNHQDTRYMTYAFSPQSVWYLIQQYSTVVDNVSPTGYVLFGSYDAETGLLTFPNYSRPTTMYNRIRRNIYQSIHLNPAVQNVQANLAARSQFISYMSTEYKGGLVNRIAQSRIASSYGPLQLLYTTALDRSYPTGIHDTPENLNVLTTFFPFAMAYYVRCLSHCVTDINSGNWNDGFEGTMVEVYQQWNSKPGYNSGVMANATKYPPTR